MMNKKLKSLIFISVFFLSAAGFVAAAEMTHPGNLNLDLSGFARNINLTEDSAENAYSCVINLKFKKSIPERGDTVTVFLKYTGSFSTDKIKCEFLADDSVIASGVLNNNVTKARCFDSSVELPLSGNLGETNKIKLSFTNIEQQRPWIQLKEAKLPKKSKASEKDSSISETKTEELEEEVVIQEPEEPVTEEVTEATETEDTAETADTAKASKQKAEKKTKEKSQKGGFLAWLKSLFNKKGKKIPKEIQTYVDSMEKDENSLFISTMTKKKKLTQITGPFKTNEQLILTWIYKELPQKDKYAVANNDTYITDSPFEFFADSYNEVTAYIAAYGMEEAFKKYFSAEAESKATKKEPVVEKPVIQDIKKETEKPEPEKEPEPVTTEEEPEEIEEPVDETPFFELPLNNDSKTSYSQYEKEYLQDYAPKKKLELPKETISERKIENPDEADSFGRTLLMKAAQSGNNWEMKSLLASGANVNLKDNDGWTALMYAIRYQENISIVETLINAGAKIKVKNKYDLSPLIIAASYNGNPEITKKILSYYSVSEKEVLQAFVLMLSDNSSSDFAKLAKIEEFLYKSIPLNTFYNGKTPLMYAAQYSDSTKILNCLLEAGAITSIRSTEGKTAFDYAQENKLLAHDDYYWALNRK